jgi:hypothetical protein
MKRSTALGAIFLLLTTPGLARGDEKHECVSASYDGQKLRDEGKLLDARAQFVRCAVEECPALVVAECARWLKEIEERVPTVVFAVRDADGHDVLSATVSIDGKPLVGALEGRAVPVDAGRHTFRFAADGKIPVLQEVIIREGERGRVVAATLRPVVVSPAPEEVRQPPLWPAMLAGSVGVLAIGGFAVVGGIGQSEKNQLEQSCASSRSCASGDVDAARTKLVLADVALGVGVLAIGLAAYLFVDRAMARANAPPHSAQARALR